MISNPQRLGRSDQLGKAEGVQFLSPSYKMVIVINRSCDEISSFRVNQETVTIQMPKLLDKKHQYWPISLLFLQLPIGHQNGPYPLVFPISLDCMVLLLVGPSPSRCWNNIHYSLWLMLYN